MIMLFKTTAKIQCLSCVFNLDFGHCLQMLVNYNARKTAENKEKQLKVHLSHLASCFLKYSKHKFLKTARQTACFIICEQWAVI